MSIAFSTYSMRVDSEDDLPVYDWCVFATSDPEALRRVRSVKYTLHPTFPNPTRVTSDVEHRFVLMTRGWGGFGIGIEVEMFDGSIETLTHRFSLRANDWPRPADPEHFATDSQKSVYGILRNPRYRWRKFNSIVSQSGLASEAVQEALNELSRQELAREAPTPAIDGQARWGATATVGIVPRL
jgi:transcription initiation factor IIF auxiliary subunit